MAQRKSVSRNVFDAGKRQGELEGEQRARTMVLTFLEEKYMNKELVRGSAEAEAILKVAREIAELLRNAPHGE